MCEVGRYNYSSGIASSLVGINISYCSLYIKILLLGETPAHFAMLTSPSDTRSMIRRLTETDVVLLCINDDVAIGHDEVQGLLKNWQDEQWRHPAAWEI